MNSVFADIGNSSIVLFYVKNNDYVLLRSYCAAELEKNIRKLLSDNEDDYLKIYASSVNSEKLKELTDVLHDFPKAQISELDPFMLRNRVRELGYTIPNLDILGSDMLFDLLGAEPSTLIADYGTASKLMPLDKDKVFLGGMIGPGLKVLNDSLFKTTDKLGDYQVELPPDYVNYSTEGAINASTTFGEAFKLNGMLDHVRKDLKDNNISLVITGGDGNTICKAMKKLGFNDASYDPLLVFKGISKATGIYKEYFEGEKK